MAEEKWRLEGEWLKNCSCAYGCPCDFNARPTQGWCKGLVAMHIDKGHFGGVKLDGLSFAATVHFPGALHEGNGAIQPIIDERASAEQRNALLEIMSGKHSDDGTMFHIFSLIVTKVHDPLFVRSAGSSTRRRAVRAWRLRACSRPASSRSGIRSRAPSTASR